MTAAAQYWNIQRGNASADLLQHWNSCSYSSWSAHGTSPSS